MVIWDEKVQCVLACVMETERDYSLAGSLMELFCSEAAWYLLTLFVKNTTVEVGWINATVSESLL